MSDDNEAARESLPSISDLSLNPQTTPSTDGKPKPKKDAAEKGLSILIFGSSIKMLPHKHKHTSKMESMLFSHFSGNFVKTNGQRTNHK